MPESYVLLRSVLEYAAYGILLEGSTALTEVWLARNSSTEAKAAAARSQITWGAAKRAARDRDHSERLGDAVESLYERSLSFGAHPNEDAVFSNMQMAKRDDGGLAFTVNYLSADGDAVNLALKTTVQVGFAALRIWQLIYPAKFSLLLLDERMDRLGSSGI